MIKTRTCVYCSQAYDVSFDRHKLLKCSNYAINPRSECLYCGKALDSSYRDHLLQECKRAPAKVLKQLRLDYKGISEITSNAMKKPRGSQQRSVRTVIGGGKRTKS